MNPYDFVRFGEPARRIKPLFHDRFKGQNGSLLCKLTACTPVFVPQTQEAARSDPRLQRNEHQELAMKRRPDGVPILPGSSLKGVLRSVAESISGSCLTLPQRRYIEYRDRPPVSYQVPPDFEHCQDVANLCPSCRIFGFLNGGKSFLGKTNISDAVAIGEVKTKKLTIEALMEPKPRHRVWYGDIRQHEIMHGRKFYYNRPLGPRTTSQRTRYNKTIEAAQPGSVFKFVVDYNNLTDDELSLLIYAISLESKMCHKVGMGKPVGLGSAKIAIIGWNQLDIRARYSEQLCDGINKLKGELLDTEIDRWRSHYFENYNKWQDSLKDLQRIWSWDTLRKKDIQYPSRNWFRENSREPLERAP